MRLVLLGSLVKETPGHLPQPFHDMKQIQDTDRVFRYLLALEDPPDAPDSPSLRRITGLLPCGVRRITSSANHKNNATLPTNSSVRTRLFCALGVAQACLLPHHFLDHMSAVRTNGSIVYTAPTAAIFFLFAFSPLPRRGFARVGRGMSVSSSGGAPCAPGVPLCNPLSPPRAVLPRRLPEPEDGLGTLRHRWHFCSRSRLFSMLSR